MKKLTIKEFVRDLDGKNCIQITEQTHRGTGFSNISLGSAFFKHNEFVLSSMGAPGIMDKKTSKLLYNCKYGLYVRGHNFCYDNNVLKIPSKVWLEKMRDTIKTYNKYFSNCNDCTERHCNSCYRNK
jgi:hypothetical protein